jgi:cytochrome c oxidase subunit 2
MKTLSRPVPWLAASAVVVALGGCTGWQSALDPHASEAHDIARLIQFFVVVCTAIWLAVVATMLVSLWRGKPERPVEPAAELRMKRNITIAVAATALTVTILCIASFVVTHAVNGDDPQSLVVKVRGYQWWWEVRYPDAEPANSIVTANEIHVPVGRPVRVELAAADVIHSFWVPNLAGKQDAIPGRDNTLRFTAREPGIYRGQCAEFCGLQHAHMSFIVVAETPDAFEAWRARQRAAGRAPETTEEAAGRDEFVGRQCGACHAVRGTPASGNLGPDLTHVASRATIAAGLLETTRGALAAWIADPQTLKPGNNMPLVPLSADELSAVSAYLASLR